MAGEIGIELSGNELDILAALWRAREEGIPALKLAEIHRRINQRRQDAGLAPIQPTTVSTYLRSMTERKLLKQVTIEITGAEGQRQTYASDSRGLIPTSRSPKTGYEAAHDPGVVLERTSKALAEAYGPNKRRQALVDFARALGMSPKLLKELEKWLPDKIS